jgi:hypothetical protein
MHNSDFHTLNRILIQLIKFSAIMPLTQQRYPYYFCLQSKIEEGAQPPARLSNLGFASTATTSSEFKRCIQPIMAHTNSPLLYKLSKIVTSHWSNEALHRRAQNTNFPEGLRWYWCHQKANLGCQKKLMRDLPNWASHPAASISNALTPTKYGHYISQTCNGLF